MRRLIGFSILTACGEPLNSQASGAIPSTSRGQSERGLPSTPRSA